VRRSLLATFAVAVVTKPVDPAITVFPLNALDASRESRCMSSAEKHPNSPEHKAFKHLPLPSHNTEPVMDAASSLSRGAVEFVFLLVSFHPPSY
jgi:hypothetical protein